MESAAEFIARKSRQWEDERDRLIRMKHISRRGHHNWIREAWTWLEQSDYPHKVFVVERLRMVSSEGTQADEESRGVIGDIQYRFGYFIVGRVGRAAGRWTWGQFSPMIPQADLSALLDRARSEGTILSADQLS